MKRREEGNSMGCFCTRAVTGLAGLLVILVAGAVAGEALAQGRGNDKGNHWDKRRHQHDWNGGYYRAPPIIYGSPRYDAPYYYPPPVIFGPSPGFTLQIR